MQLNKSQPSINKLLVGGLIFSFVFILATFSLYNKKVTLGQTTKKSLFISSKQQSEINSAEFKVNSSKNSQEEFLVENVLHEKNLEIDNEEVMSNLLYGFNNNDYELIYNSTYELLAYGTNEEISVLKNELITILKETNIEMIPLALEIGRKIIASLSEEEYDLFLNHSIAQLEEYDNVNKVASSYNFIQTLPRMKNASKKLLDKSKRLVLSKYQNTHDGVEKFLGLQTMFKLSSNDNNFKLAKSVLENNPESNEIRAIIESIKVGRIVADHEMNKYILSYLDNATISEEDESFIISYSDGI